MASVSGDSAASVVARALSKEESPSEPSEILTHTLAGLVTAIMPGNPTVMNMGAAPLNSPTEAGGLAVNRRATYPKQRRSPEAPKTGRFDDHAPAQMRCWACPKRRKALDR